MTVLLPSAGRRSRFLLDFNIASCLEASEQALDAQTGQVATFARAAAKYAVDANGMLGLVPHSLPAIQWTTDPVSGLKVPGLTLDGGTNLLLRSQEFNTTWGKTNITVTSDAAIAPDGTLTADKIAAAASVSSVLSQDVVAVTAGPHTFSLYVKMGTASAVARSFLLRNATTSAVLAQGTLDYATGVFTNISGATSVTVLANGWYRVNLTAVSGIAIGNTLTAYVGFVGGAQVAGDFLYAWGAQLNAGGEIAYIPTTSAALARAVDTCSLAFNASPGPMTIYLKFVERGTLSIANAVLVSVGNAIVGGHNIYAPIPGGFATLYNNVTTSNALAAPAIGDSVEVVATVTAAGAVQQTTSINGSAAVVGAASAGTPLLTAFTNASVSLNAIGAGNVGATEVRQLRIAAGVQSLATMQAG